MGTNNFNSIKAYLGLFYCTEFLQSVKEKKLSAGRNNLVSHRQQTEPQRIWGNEKEPKFYLETTFE